MDPRGSYPPASFATPNSVFQVEGGDIYSVVRAAPNRTLSELSWAFIEEIRLWAAVSLSIPERAGFYVIYPSTRTVYFDPYDLPAWDLGDEDTQRLILWKLYEAGSGEGRRTTPYEVHHFTPDPKELRRLFHTIENSNDAVLRGLVCLLKGQMLFQHWAFQEEAALAIYTSMSAVLGIIRGHLTREKQPDASFADVYEFLASMVSYGEGLTSCLQDCWDNRIILAHPDSRHGAYPIPPLVADDYYETYQLLVSLWRFVLIDAALPEGEIA
jgi:hypothetical protein